MNMNATVTPSLIHPVAPSSEVGAQTLTDLLYDGFLMLFMLHKGDEPGSAQAFAARVQDYLGDFERRARTLGIAGQDIHAAKYAFCAAIDETILQSNFAIRAEWYEKPLQLTLFGDQLAGINFFQHLDELRFEGASRIQALEVFHMCLLMGFQGKYLFEGKEKLGFLVAKLGDEIARIRSKRSGFAPYWSIPDQISHSLKRDAPLWGIGALICLLAIVAFVGIGRFLQHETNSALAKYQNIVNVGPRSAHLTITLP